MYIRNTPYDKVLRSNKLTSKKTASELSIFDYINGNVKRTKETPGTSTSNVVSAEKTEDVIVVSEETLKKMRNEYITQTLDSGEPLTGVSYEDFTDYMHDRMGYYSEERFTKQLYYQAQKGWKASCAEHEWRTNPNFILRNPLTTAMLDAPELIEDREAAYAKFERGEELTRFEDDLLSCVHHIGERCDRVNPIVQERANIAYKQKLYDSMNSSGVELSPDDEITFTVWGYDILDVKGTVDDDKLAAIKEAMKDRAFQLDDIGGKEFRKKLSNEQNILFAEFQKAQHYLDEAGGGSLLDIYKDKDGNFGGLPAEISDYMTKHKNDLGDDRAALNVIRMEHAFDAAIKSVQCGYYGLFRAATSTITYKNGEFFAG